MAAGAAVFRIVDNTDAASGSADLLALTGVGLPRLRRRDARRQQAAEQPADKKSSRTRRRHPASKFVEPPRGREHAAP
jgi:hypothetical protein